MSLFITGYDILSVIGTGGSSIVYKGKEQSTGRIVAIKVLEYKESCAAIRSFRRDRFKNEASLCKSLRHPNIVSVLNEGTTEDNKPFIVYEFLEGETLKEYILRYGELSLDTCIKIMKEILSVLVYIHRKKIVHHDLKPQNIMVTECGSELKVKIIDFGISCGVHEVFSQGLPQGYVIGTPRYSAPEKINNGYGGIKSDLYTWGLLFLEGITGRPVVRGGTINDIIEKQLDSKDISLPQKIVSHPVAKILQRVLKKSEYLRWGNTAEIFHEIDTFDRVVSFPEISSQKESFAYNLLRA